LELRSYLKLLQKDERFACNVTYWGERKPTPASYVSMPAGIHPDLLGHLQKIGITKLYSHQARAYNLITSGRDVVLATPTASGKSLAYNLPVLNDLLSDQDAKAIYLFPTKALSQDQVKVLEEFTLSDLRLYIYDGDTPSSIRQAARRNGRLIVTNPDMLHTGILPNHPKWVKIFDGLKYVILDELHTYSGVFGSHLSHIMRRLLRVAAFYRSRPIFIASSATIENPENLFFKITGSNPVLIDRSGAPSGEKHYIIYNPPFVNREQGIRRGVVLESVGVAMRFIEQNLATIIFAKSRLNTEVILSYLKQRMPKKQKQIAGYRGGYLPNERRTIEHGLRDGDLKCVVSTNALELGIDIGSLDVSIMAGYPGTVASFHQQGGRSGRKDRTSVSILIASNAPLDQYIAYHPEYLMERSPEAALINPQNVYILVDQVKCAAFELPFKKVEEYGGEEIQDVLEYLEEKDVLHEEEGVYHWQDRSYPAENVSIRSADVGNFVIIDRTHGARRVIGEMDRSSVPIMLHENAIYIHGSEQYTVVSVEWEKQTVWVEKSKVNYYTDAETKTDIKILERNREEDLPPYCALLCDVLVRTVAVKYKKIKFGTHENIGYGDISLPPTEIHTRSFVLSFKDELFRGLSRDESEGLLLSISNLLRSISALFVMTDPRDIGVAENLKQQNTGLPTVFLYDRYPGGVGLADRLYDTKHQILQSSLQRVEECGCSEGCPSCVGPDRFNKKLTVQYLKRLLEKGITLVEEEG
jgi:DEAD/DEAH box helicase domain-containing protein